MFNSRQLALRDPAAAAMLGLISASDFGSEAEIGWEATGADGFFGADAGFFGADFGADFGYDGSFEGDFGADAVPAAPPPSHPAHPAHPMHRHAVMAMWQKQRAHAMKQSRRQSLLHPNAGVADKVERYELNLSQNFLVGAATALNMTKQPDTHLRPQRITANVIVPMLVFYSEIKLANVSITSGDAGDAYNMNANAWGTQFDAPTLSPSNRATILGNTTTFIPPNFLAGSTYTVVFSLKGPSSEVA